MCKYPPYMSCCVCSVHKCSSICMRSSSEKSVLRTTRLQLFLVLMVLFYVHKHYTMLAESANMFLY